jgi:ComEC/Rec2-related protein
VSLTLHPADLAFGLAILFLFGLFAVNLGWHLYVLFIAAILAAVASILIKKRLWKESVLFVAALIAGALYYHFYFHIQEERIYLPFGTPTTFSAIVSDEPQPTDKYLILAAKTQPPLVGTIRILAPQGSKIQYGDFLQMTGVINPPEEKGDEPVVFSPKIVVVAHHRGFAPREWMVNLKLAVLDRFKALLSADEAALLGGIAFGSKQNFKTDLKDAMAASGLTHLVAVSGYNITIVLFAVSQSFGRFLSRRATFYVAIVFLVLFMLMVGGAASGVRAAIMGFLALVARESGELFDMRNGIAFTAVAMTLFEPTALVKNMSFVLSFLSLLGIVYLQPPLKKLLGHRDGGFLEWKENAATTLSAQLAVIPVLVAVFGQFSATAIAANVLVLGTVPLTMFLGLLLAVLAFISPYLTFSAAKLAGLLLGYQLFVMRLFAKLAVPLPLPFNSAFSIFFYYLILATFVFFHGRAQKN